MCRKRAPHSLQSVQQFPSSSLWLSSRPSPSTARITSVGLGRGLSRCSKAFHRSRRLGMCLGTPPPDSISHFSLDSGVSRARPGCPKWQYGPLWDGEARRGLT